MNILSLVISIGTNWRGKPKIKQLSHIYRKYSKSRNAHEMIQKDLMNIQT